MITFSRTVLAAFAVTMSLSLGATISSADPVRPKSTELRKYLIIGTGGGSAEDFTAVDIANSEIGADQRVLSTGSNVGTENTTSFSGDPNTRGVFVKEGDSKSRWVPDATLGYDHLPLARPLFQGVDWTGNVALTGENSQIHTSNVDVHADLGVKCNRSPGDCDDTSNSSFFADQQTSSTPLGPDTSPGFDGMSQFGGTSLSDLNAELVEWNTFVSGLAADVIISEDIKDINSEKSTGPFVFDLDAIDDRSLVLNDVKQYFDSSGGTDRIAFETNELGKSDGLAVIDIDMGDRNSFNVVNSDWILDTDEDTFVIFRMRSRSCYDFNDSSIMLGGGAGPKANTPMQAWGGMFFLNQTCHDEGATGTNTVFDLDNVILGGMALWDMVDIENGVVDGDNSVIHLSNVQGCSQFIGHKVDLSDNRWNRCSAGGGAQVPEPASLALFTVGLLGLGYARRRRTQKAL